MSNSTFARVAADVKRNIASINKTAASDRNAEWQRVHSGIADVLKDDHVLYAKLARLQGDFQGPERDELEKISDDILTIGESLSRFARAFYEGKLQMVEGNITYGEEGGSPMPERDIPPPAPEGDVPVEFAPEEEPLSEEDEEEEEVPEEEEK
jgi:hypothetical protein